jgi:uncharacterized protein (DUF2126 family)/transglutaminase-like putative cysteine protease
VGIKVALEHRTSYRFDRLVTVHPHVVRLRPAPHSRTAIEAYSLTVTPSEHFVNWQQDAFGNHLARLVFPERTTELSVTVGLVADLAVVNPFDFFIEEYAERFGFDYPDDLRADLAPYLAPVDEQEPGSGPGAVVTDWVRRLDGPGLRARHLAIVDFLVEVNSAIRRDVGYAVRMEPGVQTPDHTLATAIGSCRDSAWLLVSVLRQLGLAARFVSGYLIQLTADQVSLDGPSGPDADFTDLHAWAEVYVPGAGWIGLDPTSGLFAGEGHIPLAATPHPFSAAPITGSTGPCEVTFDFANLVTRVHEDPRVSLPYTASQWAAIDALGSRVDDRLAAGDVRLTMGGEPTFVSIDDFRAAEWTIAADGPQKRERAAALAQRLADTHAAGGLVHHGQGKWYPGEPLPRWQIGLYRRTDGVPLWSDPALLAGFRTAGNATNDAAPDFARALAGVLGLPESQVRPAYEDGLARLVAQVRLPAGDPPARDLVDDGPDARAALVADLDAPADTPTAWVLPLARVTLDGDTADSWVSPAWRLRRGRIVLLPGESPAGLRLPLDAVSWEGAEPPVDPDPLRPAGPLPVSASASAAVVVDPDGMPTTALVAQVRDGQLFVFLPPVTELDAFTELIAAVEQAAQLSGATVVLEGYPPPGDPRLTTLTVTPDPGVIEVNVPPTSTWPDQVTLTETLYEQARLSRLGTETFAVDGGHAGTGGGNHITLGGTTPADSPLLRRPDLLVSLLTHWQRHPSLSYLFSGRFIGPTSQAPRVDEGRPDMLYELEIAFAEIARLTDEDGTAPPWVVDRALRHILTDLTGNTHRAEFCIDKLYSPDSARGRLGLLELRGFEMPPHPQMALVQALLVRSLVTRFWDEPLRAPLVRHGENLHGRYLLPYFVIADIAAVAADLRSHGIDFATSWLDPFTEFRFPRIGTATAGGLQLELRGAIEPWHVLGEEATGGGTARYVDSSAERLQVLTDGLDPGRHLLTCNGVPVPLLATDTPGRHVAGVRYRAWQPPSALHPTIEVQSPLRFDVVDLDGAVSLGGATYHVHHPGGRAYDTPPMNALEAEARRSRRFEAAGHTPGRIDVGALREAAARLSVDATPSGLLDLRRAAAVLR